MFGFIKSWRLLLVIFAMWPVVAAASSRIPIPATKKGPGYDLQKKGLYSKKALALLEHKNGRKVKPSEYRRLHDAVYYLPVNAKPAAGRSNTAARRFRRANQKRIRSAFATAQSLRNEITRLNNNVIIPLREEKRKLKEKAGKLPKAEADLKQTQTDLAAEKLRHRGDIPWWWVAIAAITSGLVCGIISYSRGRKVIEQPVELSIARAQAKSNQERAETAEQENRNLRDRWNDLPAVKKQYEKLQAESTRQTQPPP